MEFIHNIRTVAQYEAKTLRRSWFFRLFSIGALTIFTFLNIGLFSPVGDESWELVSISSAVPYVNLYLLNIAQAIVVIFLAADFLKRDKKVDTNEVLYTRSMSNFEYVIGKTWGILRLFLGLNIIILGIGLLMNIISKTLTLDLAAYLYYILLLSVPTIIFSLGLAFVLMSLIRNQAITFLLLLGIAGLDIFYLWFRMGYIFDYMAFGLPLFKSGVVGFDNLEAIINQRLIFLFIGLSLVMATILLFKRLPQSHFYRGLSYSLMVLFFAAGGVCAFNTYKLYSDDIEEKERVIGANRIFEERLFASTTWASIDLTHKGESIEAAAALKILNDNDKPLDSYLFSLNPSLKVLKVSSGGKELSFTLTNHILEVNPGRALNPGATDSVLISYAGKISEAFCYPNYNDNPKETQYRIDMLPVNKRQAFIGEDFLLLTPETHWYPVTALNYYPSNPARIKIDFTRFTLKVRSESGLSSVSQGSKSEGDGYSLFLPDSPLTGLTLAIGDYAADTLKVDSVSYITHYFKGHDYYKKDLTEIKDTLTHLVSGVMRELETNFNTKYPFTTLNLLEVPVQFYSYPKKSTQTRAEVQPSIVLLPEKLSTLQNAGFGKQFTRQKKRMARNNQVITDKELQVRIFNNFIRNTFISGENFRYVNGVAMNEPTRYRLGPSFYFFKNHFYSSEYPVMNAVFESHLQQLPQQGQPGGFNMMQGTLSNNDRANLILKNMSFKELLAKNPVGDSVRIVLSVKGDYLFNLLRSKAGIEEFKIWFAKYIDDNIFRSVDIKKFNSDLNEKFGFGFYPYLNDWFNSKEQPGFLITDMQVKEIIVGDRTRYQVTFAASNPEPVTGIFNIAFRTGGPGGGGRGGMTVQDGPRGGSFTISMQGRGMDASDISKIIILGPRESKRIGIVLDAQPRAMMLNYLYTKNIPGEINMPVNDIIKVKGSYKEVSGEEMLSSMPDFKDPSEIIVDNEDPGFISSRLNSVSPLKKILGIENNKGELYETIRMWNIPEYWQPVVLSAYNGRYIRSAVYTRSGTGDRSVKWITPIKDPGYYDIYCYVGKISNRMVARGGAGQGARGGGPGGPGGQGGPGLPVGELQAGEDQYKDMHYKIYHDEGVEEITLDYQNADGGWNMLGRYYLSPDSAKVELTNQSAGRIVIGDAIRWVKQN